MTWLLIALAVLVVLCVILYFTTNVFGTIWSKISGLFSKKEGFRPCGQRRCKTQ